MRAILLGALTWLGMLLAVRLPAADRPDFAQCSEQQLLEWVSWGGLKSGEAEKKSLAEQADVGRGTADEALQRLLGLVRPAAIARAHPLPPATVALPERGTLRLEVNYLDLNWYWAAVGDGFPTYVLRWTPEEAWLVYSWNATRRSQPMEWEGPPSGRLEVLRLDAAEARRIAELLLGLATRRFGGAEVDSEKSVRVGTHQCNQLDIEDDGGASAVRLRADVSVLRDPELLWRDGWRASLAVHLAHGVVLQLRERLHPGKAEPLFRAVRDPHGGDSQLEVVPAQLNRQRDATQRIFELARVVGERQLRRPLAVAVNTVGEFGFAELAPEVERLAASLPPASAWDRQRQALQTRIAAVEERLGARGIPGLAAWLQSYRSDSEGSPEQYRSEGIDPARMTAEVVADLRERAAVKQELWDLTSLFRADSDRADQVALAALRETIDRARRQLTARDDPAALRAWAASSGGAGADWAYRRLQELSAPEANGVIAARLSALEQAPPTPDRALAYERLWQRWPRTTAAWLANRPLADRLWFEEGLSKSEHLASLGVAELTRLLATVSMAEDWNAALTRLSVLGRQASPAPAEILRALRGVIEARSKPRAENRFAPDTTATAAAASLLQLDGPGQFDFVCRALGQELGFEASVLEPLARIASGSPARRTALAKKLRLREAEFVAEIALLAGAVELRPQVQREAAGRFKNGEEMPRAASARLVLSLWDTKQPWPRARLCAAAIVGLEPPEDSVPTWCREELTRLAPKLDPPQRDELVRTAESLARQVPDPLNRRTMDRAAEVAAALAAGAARAADSQ